VQVSSEVCDLILNYVQLTRSHPGLLLGASPRGSLGLFRASQSMAAISGKGSVDMDGVKKLAAAVLAHRLILRPEEIKRGVLPESIVEGLVTGAKPH
jgi:MoxR-like ATPase